MYDLAEGGLENNQVTIITTITIIITLKKHKSHEIINGIDYKIGNLVGGKKLISIRIINQIFLPLFINFISNL